MIITASKIPVPLLSAPVKSANLQCRVSLRLGSGRRILGKLSAFALTYPLEAGVVADVAQNKHGYGRAVLWDVGNGK